MLASNLAILFFDSARAQDPLSFGYFDSSVETKSDFKNTELMSNSSVSALEKSKFDYQIIDRQLGRMVHLNGTRGHYDRSTLLEERRK